MFPSTTTPDKARVRRLAERPACYQPTSPLSLGAGFAQNFNPRLVWFWSANGGKLSTLYETQNISYYDAHVKPDLSKWTPLDHLPPPQVAKVRQKSIQL